MTQRGLPRTPPDSQPGSEVWILSARDDIEFLQHQNYFSHCKPNTCRLPPSPCTRCFIVCMWVWGARRGRWKGVRVSDTCRQVLCLARLAVPHRVVYEPEWLRLCQASLCGTCSDVCPHDVCSDACPRNVCCDASQSYSTSLSKAQNTPTLHRRKWRHGPSHCVQGSWLL